MLNFIVSDMNFKLKHIVLLLAIGSLYMACVKKKKYSLSPEIEYKSFFPTGDYSAILTIGFSDGDGDIGKEKEDKSYNLFTTYYYFDTITNKFRAFYDAINKDTLRTPYTVRKPIDDYSGKPISGELSIDMNEYRPTTSHKRIKYVMYLVDNAGNQSNVLTTPEINVP